MHKAPFVTPNSHVSPRESFSRGGGVFIPSIWTYLSSPLFATGAGVAQCVRSSMAEESGSILGRGRRSGTFWDTPVSLPNERRLFFLRVKLINHIHLVQSLRWSYTSTPTYIFGVRSLTKHKEVFTQLLAVTDISMYIIFPQFSEC